MTLFNDFFSSVSVNMHSQEYHVTCVGLERHDGASLMAEFSFLGELSL